MTGLSAAKLAEKDLQAPAITVENEETFWSDIGKHWYRANNITNPTQYRWLKLQLRGKKAYCKIWL